MFQKLFQTLRLRFNYNQKQINLYYERLKPIAHYEKSISSLNDDDFQQSLRHFLHTDVKQQPNQLLAYIRDASRRILGLHPFDVQMIGALVLIDQRIAEMKTGEGKTLVAAIAAIYKALMGQKVHVITVNDYLAQRDQNFLKPLFEQFNLSSACNIQNDLKQEERIKYKQSVFQSNIIYSTGREMIFDFLISRFAKNKEEVYIHPSDLQFCIIDEADSVLIDEARQPFILSFEQEMNIDFLKHADNIVHHLLVRSLTDRMLVLDTELKVDSIDSLMSEDNEQNNGDYFYDEAHNSIHLFESAYEKIEQKLLDEKIIIDRNELYQSKKSFILNLIHAAIHARNGYLRDRNYVVENDKVIIIDSATGRLNHHSRWSKGLHQAVEIKEGVSVQPENDIKGQMTFQHYFNLYAEKSGMTGTAQTEAAELLSVYGLETLVIPPNQSVQRIDHEDRLFLNKKQKYDFLLEMVREKQEKGQPILIGTPALYISEEIAQLFTEQNIPFNILNAKNHQREAQIIQDAGKPYAITIATNMAGRGTDIVLGGHVPKDFNDDDFSAWLDDYRQQRQQVMEAGGLCVIGVERNPSRRIDNQLRGRSGRQGEIGESIFLISLEDEMIRQYLNPKILAYAYRFFEKYQDVKDINQMKQWKDTFEQTQINIEKHHFELRRNMYKNDELLSKQQELFYQIRQDILFADAEALNQKIIQDWIPMFVQNIAQQTSPVMVKDVVSQLKQSVQHHLDYLPESYFQEWEHDETFYDEALHLEPLSKIMQTLYTVIWQNILLLEGQEAKTQFERMVSLETYDTFWSQYLNELEYVRQGSLFSVYAGKKPDEQYQANMHHLFMQMLERCPIQIMQKIWQEDMRLNLEWLDVEQLVLSEDIKNMSSQELMAHLRDVTRELLDAETLRNKKLDSL